MYTSGHINKFKRNNLNENDAHNTYIKEWHFIVSHIQLVCWVNSERQSEAGEGDYTSKGQCLMGTVLVQVFSYSH